MEELRKRVYGIVLFFCIGCFISFSPCDASAPPPYLLALRSQCPLSFSFQSPLQVGGDFIDRALTSRQRSTYTSALFYASWCPFSRRIHFIFEALSSMYPQIEHLAVEQSSAMPSLFSRYGIHSVPAILIFNRTSRTWFHDCKDLDSLSKFYRRTTGLKPIQFVDVDHSGVLRKNARFATESKLSLPLNEMLSREPYLSFAVAFLCLRVIWIVAQRLMYHIKAFWTRYRPNPNLDIFGETGQILRRIVQAIDMKGLWTKLRQCKIRNLHHGARSARVWASSLASVSLGESSTSR
ncbi:5'-adenylylsulfate reductase-like 5 [Nicotiana tomentosiformis]|uniref:5'-adenylylsulfate reductase-like 5 n=1 Tax=Nicotiana tomentosiformis TaxID=4098 RepID=UPI00051B72ED|nr:5'-adenylylsulfate reductase-like 5 [Nicotiana tomentosiformis]